MAVQPALLMWSRAGSSADASDNFRRLNVMFTEAYQILHDVAEPELNKYLSPGLPASGAVYPGTNFVLAGRARMDQVSPIMTIATVEYRGEIAPLNGSGQPSLSPLNAPPSIDWDTVLSEEEIDEDIHGKRIQTKAGERIRGIKAEFPDIVLTVQRNFAAWNSYTQAAFSRAVNSTLFAGWPAGTGKVMKLKATSVIADPDKGLGYWRATLQVKFRIPWRTTADKAWFARTFHQGFVRNVPLSGPTLTGGLLMEIWPCFDNLGQKSTVPKALTVEGYQATEETEHNWLEFERYIPMDLNLLGFL